MTLPRFLAIAVLYAVAPCLLAQDTAARAAPQASSCTFDTTKFRKPLSLIIYAALPQEPRLSRKAKAEALEYLFALQDHFVRPSSLTMPDAAFVLASDGTTGAFGIGLGGKLILPLGANGRLRETAVISQGLIPELNAALIAAVRAIDSAGPPLLADWVAAFHGATVALRIDDGPRMPDEAVGLLRARVSILESDFPVLPKNQPRPLVPSGWIGPDPVSVDLRYIVDISGRAEPSSIEVLEIKTGPILQETHLVAFAQSAIETIRGSTFTSAKAGGCPVRQWVQQSVVFNPWNR